MLCMNYLTRGRCPLRPPLLPDRPRSTFRNDWGKFCSIEPLYYIPNLTRVSAAMFSMP